MSKGKLEIIELIYYPYKLVKRILGYIRYLISLFCISQNKKRVRNKIAQNEVLNVIFLVQYIPSWIKLEAVYSKMQKDKRFNPIIVCVPLNIQNHKLMDDNGNDTYRYFVEHGYNAIDALADDGSWFDLKQLNPDYVFHSRPYNYFMPKDYTSGRIVKYALICNVPYGAGTTKEMCEVGINNDYFYNVFCFFSTDEGEKEYYKKRFYTGFMLGVTTCYPYGAIGLERMLKKRSYKATVPFKKTIIWTPRWSTDPVVGGSNFFNYKQLILDIAKEQPDVLFIIRPHPLMFDNFIKTGEFTAQEAAQFKDYCSREKNIILDQSKEYTETFLFSDFLVADISSIIPEYFVTQKPIIYCRSNIDFHYTKAAREMLDSCYSARNSTELRELIFRLINDEDTKSDERRSCIEKHFSYVVNNSENILKALAKI